MLGAGDRTTASHMFSKTVLAVSLFSIILSLLVYLLLPSFFKALGATDDLLNDTTTYVTIFLPFIPFLMVGIVFDYFVKIDNRPIFAFFALLFSAFVNILLDWLFIAYFEQGILGAALATGISQLALFLFLIPHFFSKKSAIKFIKPKGQWLSIIKAAGNGSSEFINEASVGITAIIFNYVMLQNFGVDGVAAYAVISYLIWFSIMINFGISDALQPVLSKNYGAQRFDRIAIFLKYALLSVSVIGVTIIVLLWQFPHYLTDLFLQSKDEQAIIIVMKFVMLIWPLFLFNGISLVISACFTATHKPLPSAAIAIARSLLLPVFFVYLLPLFFGDMGIYLAIPASEFLAMILALVLYRQYRTSTPGR